MTGRPLAAATRGDVQALPPVTETLTSKDGQWRLTLTSLDGPAWSAQRCVAEMSHLRSAAGKPAWRLELPHVYRPREAVVSSLGEAVFFDDWIHVKSARAIVVVDREGVVRATWSAAVVLERLGADLGEVTRLARRGVWMQAAPRWSADGRALRVSGGDRTLEVRLPDGQLSRV